MKLKYYVILNHEGKVKSNLHSQYARACFWAKDDGDSVVEVEIDLDRQPLFIRKKTLDVG
jgi:hypothetical protein